MMRRHDRHTLCESASLYSYITAAANRLRALFLGRIFLHRFFDHIVEFTFNFGGVAFLFARDAAPDERTGCRVAQIDDQCTLRIRYSHDACAQAVPVGGGSAIFDQTLSISSSAHQTLLITGSSSSVQSAVLTDGGTTATAGDGHVRVFNASSTMGTTDAYIVNVGTSIIGAQPVTANLAVGTDTGYQLIPTGNYEVFLTVPGTTNVNLATGPLNIGASANQTIVAFDAAGGGFTYILFTDQ